MQKKLFGRAFVRGLLILLSGAALILAFTAYSDLNRITPVASNHGTLAANASAPGSVQSELFLARTAQNSQVGGAIVIDHFNTDITAVPQAWIEQAKTDLHMAYGHTSHGSQLTTGMAGLVGFANNGGLGLAFPQDIFAFNSGGTDGALDLREPFEGDAGWFWSWPNDTRAYLGPPDPVTGRGTNKPEINVIIWAWCSQVSEYTEQEMLDRYLLPMTQLEREYPGVSFVYMTGHADGTGEEGNLHLRNQQIRDYCIDNDKILYDFYDIELYDPDGSYYGDKAVTDTCDYDSDGNGSLDRNWAIDWQNLHVEDADWYTCHCSHSQALNCNQKAYAAWWLWARLAGWDGEPQAGPQKTASTETATPGQTVTYTITIRDLVAPATATVYLTDEVPAGLSYIPGSMSSTTGVVDDDAAPVLRWVGVLSPTPVVVVTYAAIVDTMESQVISNHASITSPGYEPIIVSASITTKAPDPPELSPSYKMAHPSHGDLGDQITYSVIIRSAAGPLNNTVWLTDTVLDGLAYVPGTLTSTAGVVSEAAAPSLYWSGVLSPAPVVTVTYAATVDTAAAKFIINEAIIALPGHQRITRAATILTNPHGLYLPVILRDH